MMTEKAAETSYGSVIWARMHGFAPWPARICSAFEKKKLLKQKSSKVNEVAVTFIGTRNDSGWVTEASITPFNAETFGSKFDKKKFKSDKNYRAGVLEAVLLTRAKGQKYPTNITDMMAETTKEFQEKMSHLCSICTGSFLSGDLTTCLYCDVAEVHWHCFHPEDPVIDEKFWVCDSCCKVNKIPKGTVLTRDKILEENKKLSDASLEVTTADRAEEAPVARAEPSTSSSSKKKGSSSGGGGGGSAKKGSTSQSNPPEETVNGKSSGKVASNPEGNNYNKPQSRAEASEEDLLLNKDEEDVDDQCFVCGLDGELLMCDFPDCPRVYHPVCILKIAPKPLSIDTAGDGYDLSTPLATTEDNLWFCPKHFCTTCGVLEATKFTSLTIGQSLLLPTALSLHAKDLQLKSQDSSTFWNPQTGKRKTDWEILNQDRTIKSCRQCPFSLCNECEKTVFPHFSVFKGKRGYPHHALCLNCVQPSEQMKLAKLLESAWVKMASSRLALPFLRPLLPISSSSPSLSSAVSPDLLLLLEHIHAFKYQSSKEFEADLDQLQDLVYSQLVHFLPKEEKEAEEGGENSQQKRRKKAKKEESQTSEIAKIIPKEEVRKNAWTKTFYDSFETILEAARNFLFSREILFREIEEEIAALTSEAQDQTDRLKTATIEDKKKKQQKKQSTSQRETASEAIGGKEEGERAKAIENKTDKSSSEASEKDKETLVPENHRTEEEEQEDDDEEEEEEEKDKEEEEKVVKQEEALFQKLWRIYCHKDPLKRLQQPFQASSAPSFSFTSSSSKLLWRRSSFTQLYYLSPSSSSTPSPAQTSLITPRSLLAWKEYLEEGMIPSQYLSSRLAGRSLEEPGLSNQAILQLRNQLLLNEDTAFSKGPPETNTASRFNFFQDQCSKQLVRQLLFFHEDEQVKQQKGNETQREDLQASNHNDIDTNQSDNNKNSNITRMDQEQSSFPADSSAMKQLKQELHQEAEYLQNELDAANLLLGMQQVDGNNARENCTLSTIFSDPSYGQQMTALFPPPPSSSNNLAASAASLSGSLLDPSSKSYRQLQQQMLETPLFDEQFVILNQLQSLSQQTLALQMKLKQEYLKKQHQTFQFQQDVVTFGELRVIQELKLANDNLRWRMEQKTKTIEKFQEIVQRMQQQMKGAEKKIAALEKELQTVSSAQKESSITKEREKEAEEGAMTVEESSEKTQRGEEGGEEEEDEAMASTASGPSVGRGKKRKISSTGSYSNGSSSNSPPGTTE